MTNEEIQQFLADNNWISAGFCMKCSNRKEIFVNYKLPKFKLKISWKRKMISVEHDFRHIQYITFEAFTNETLETIIAKTEIK